MVSRRPLVIQNGLVSELLQGDTVIAGESNTEVVAGSGLVGGGSVSSNPRVDFALAANPSGLIYVGDTVGVDGSAQVSADTALASGSAAVVLSSDALASGNASLVEATAALASGNAALDLVPTLGGGGGTTAEFTAASAVVSGYAVGVDDTGRVRAVAADITNNEPPVAGSGDSANTANALYGGISYDSAQDNFLCWYRDSGNSNYGTVRVATLDSSLENVTYGTAVVFYSGTVSYGDIAYVGSSKHCVVYRANSNSGNTYANLMQVTGTSISVGGTATVYSGGVGVYPYVTYDSRNDFALITFGPDNNSYYPTLRVFEISGTTLSGGPSYSLASESASSSGAIPCYDGEVEDRCAFIWYGTSGTSGCRYVVGNITGSSSVTFGAQGTVANGTFQSRFTAFFDPDSVKVVWLGSDAFTTEAYVVTATVNNASLTVGTVNNFASKRYDTMKLTSYTSTSRIIGILENYTDDTSDVQTFEVSGTSISANTAAEFWSYGGSDMHGIAYSSTDARAAAFIRSSNDSYPYTVVLDNGSSTSYLPTLSSKNNVLGIAQSTVASGSTCLVNLPGTLYNEPAANLTTGAFYYANPTTSGVTTTSTKPTSWDGQVPWNYIGRAVTSSGLMLLKSI